MRLRRLRLGGSASRGSDGYRASINRLKHNFKIAFSSSLAMGVLALLTTAVNARALPLGELGSLILVQSAAALINGIGSFSSHLAVMRSGAFAIERNDTRTLVGIVRLARKLDLGAGLAGAIVALACFGPLGEALGFTHDMRVGMAFFAAGLVFSGLYSGLGILRLLDRFEVVRAFDVGSALVLLLAALLFWALDAPVQAYFAVYALVFGGMPLARYVVALRVLRRTHDWSRQPARLGPKERRDFIRFALGSNVWASLELLRAQADTLIAGALFSNELVGLYGVAKQVSGALRRFSELASIASFAEVGRLEARGEARESKALVVRVVQLSATVGILVVLVTLLAGTPILFYGFGPEFTHAKSVLVILMTGAALHLVASPIIMYAQILRGSGLPLLASIAGLAAFGGAIFLLTGRFGLDGVAAGNVAFFVVAIAVVVASLCWGRPRATQSASAAGDAMDGNSPLS